MPWAEGLPNELLQRVFSHLDTKAQLSAGLVCQQWLSVAKPSYGHLSDIYVIFEDAYCEPSISFQACGPSTYILSFTICQCHEENHVLHHVASLRPFLQQVGSHIRSLVMEDYLLAPKAFVSSLLLDLFLEHCKGLRTIQLHQLDMSELRESTLQQFASLAHLEALVIDAPTHARFLSDALVRRVAYRGALHEIKLTHASGVGDAALLGLAKHCAHLWNAQFSGCRRITALGVFYFLRYFKNRQPDLVYVDVSRTDVKTWELEKLIFFDGSTPDASGGPGNNPALVGPDKASSSAANTSYAVISLNPSAAESAAHWSVTNVEMSEIGRRAYFVHNKTVLGKTLVVLL